MSEGRSGSHVAVGVVFLLIGVCGAAPRPACAQTAAVQPGRWQPATSQIIRARQEWFYKQRAYPLKRIPAGARLRALRQLRRMEQERREKQKLESQFIARPASEASPPASPVSLFGLPALSTTTWSLIGPQPTDWPSGSYFDFSPTSGRVTALAVDPANPNIVYLGSAEGGVWKTTDGGQHWTPLTDQQNSLAIGSIAVDPTTCTSTGCGTLYAGTGEEDFSFDNYYGAGILKSTTAGATWTQVSSPFAGPTGYSSPDCGGASIGSIAVDPANSQILLAGVFDTFCADHSKSGVYRSTDGGSTWADALPGDAATDVMFDSSGNAYAALSVYYGFSPSSGNGNGIYKSTDSGQTWTGLQNGLPSATSMGRIALAIAPSTSGSSAVLYAGVSDGSNDSATLLGVYKSANGGETWTELSGAPDYCGPPGYGSDQCYFDNVIGVSPANPSVVVLGGSETASSAGYAGTIFLSIDGGASFTDITDDSSGNGVHPDAHAIAFSADGSKLLVGTDGGAWSTSLSSGGAGAWTDLNSTLALTQFYPGMSIDPTNPASAFAGAQDNGSQQYSGQLAWNYIACGDGAQTAFNYSDLNTLYVGCSYLPPNEAPDGSPQDFLYRLTKNPPSGTPADSGIDGSDRGWFIPPLAMDPSNPNTLYFGTYRLYQTRDGGNSWDQISDDLTMDTTSIIDTVSAIAVAPSDSNTVYVGTNDGRLWATSAATQSTFPPFSNIGIGTPSRSVTSIAVSPGDAGTAYVTYSGFSGFGGDNLGHVFGTTSGGSSWTDISGNLPNIPVNDMVIDPDIANTLYIATDIGVFEGTNSSGTWTWTPLGSGLPKVAVMDLKLQHASRVLSAATYGRSAWDIQLPAPAGPTAVLSAPILLFGSQQVTTASAAQNVILTNNSSTALSISGIAPSTADFTLGAGTTCPASGGTLAAGVNCAISVEFTPTAFGPITGSVIITDNAAGGTTQTINLEGAAWSGSASFSPNSLSFGDQLVGTTSAAQTVTLTNPSTSSPLTITAIQGASDFKESSDCPLSPGTLGAGSSCTFTVTFSPINGTGQVTEQLAITDSAADSPQAIVLTGTGVAPEMAVSPGGLTFNQAVGTTSSAQTVTVSNEGTAPLSFATSSTCKNCGISILPLSAGTFNIVAGSTTCSTAASIAPGGSCVISVTFTANVTFAAGSGSDWGRASAYLNLIGNAGGLSVVLGGTGFSGAATYSSTEVNFGAVAVGQTATQSVTLTNSGASPLYVSVGFASGQDDGNLTQTTNCPVSPSSLAAGANCTITFSWTPSGNGGMQEAMGVTTSAEGFAQAISLTGSTPPPDYSLSVSGSNTASVSPGGTASYNIAVGSQGGFTGAVALACTGAPAEATCAVTPSSVTPSGAGPENVTVTVTTTAASGMPPGGGQGPPDIPDFRFKVPDGRTNGRAPEGGRRSPLRPVEMWIVLAGIAVLWSAAARRRPESGSKLPHSIALAALLLFVALWASCGGGGGGGGSTPPPDPGTPAGTYTLTVTGTSGGLAHSVNLTLTVQ